MSNAEPESRLQALASFCLPIITFLFIFTFVFQNFVIPSSSMASTLLVGDHVLVDRATLAPATPWAKALPYHDIRRGDPVVFYKPVLEPDGTNLILVKRVIGVPGDRVHLRNGIVYLNGVAQNEPYAGRPTTLNYDPYRDDFPSIPAGSDGNITAQWALELPSHIQGDDLVVPADRYFVMGDNRTNSLDGRYWGLVPRKNLIGRPLFVYWSIKTPEEQENKTGLADQAAFFVHQVIHFVPDTRWRRTFHPIR